ncbi:acyl-CoA reductase-like NAD-dependent aldehyde dehydrogenase [Mumia flava]|uniref:Acyl-CoA reductase-like NAD-dependent aldehyde dehydrogenase n=1 Tax=Mumia flava TaxID=1348852 RepID=A0A0B2BVT0_9ACTN|nr:aldehyde dehydrogenase family protein [Mumia flava]PJJ58037.1 acyl-CoA reductase-like NAD-dependent aldehyde dehydrogenase [Mumia flava]
MHPPDNLPLPTLNLVAGEWTDREQRSERIGPALGSVVSTAAQADGELADRALAWAESAARRVAAWSPAARASVLERASDLLQERRDDVARLLALELGKPIRDSRGEVQRAAETLAVAAAEGRRIGGEVLPTAGWERGVGSTAMTIRAPVGVVVAITPFNAPVNLLAHKLSASFAAGNTTIVKPPPQAPASSTALVEIMIEAGLPLQAVQVLHGGVEVGERLTSSPVVAAISFTGSAAAGHAVARSGAGKRLVLELGGNAATLVCDDADLADAARQCARTGFSNSGQSCISVQRIYVPRALAAQFADLLVEEVRGLRVGDPLDESTDIGSMVDEQAAERVRSWAAEAEQQGAKLPCGAERSGATLRPVVVVDPPPNARVVTEEAFGAVVVVLPYDDLDAVVEECNRSRYGLQAGLFTSDASRIFEIWRRLEVGAVVVGGTSNYRLDHVPFGGVKDSGIGRESPRWMIDDYTYVKTLLWKSESAWGTGP